MASEGQIGGKQCTLAPSQTMVAMVTVFGTTVEDIVEDAVRPIYCLEKILWRAQFPWNWKKQQQQKRIKH